MLVTRGAALENLTRVRSVLLDKTGTLTAGRPQIAASRSLDGDPIERHLAVAAALEVGSSHPYARAFLPHAGGLTATRVEPVTAGGVRGQVNGQTWQLGTPEFAGGPGQTAAVAALEREHGAGSWVGLGDGQRLVALFLLSDPLRADAAVTLAALARRGLAPAISSGDAAPAVAAVAGRLGVRGWQARQTPQQKLATIRARQQRGEVVLMVGDGVNDAPILAGADVSVALASGAALAHSQADLLLLGERLAPLLDGIDTARRTLTVVRQNLAWAALYNLLAMPLAAVGLVPPWLAALGMSASSALVVGNSLRLLRSPRANTLAQAEPRLA